MVSLHDKTEAEWRAVEEAKKAYRQAVKNVQESCAHSNILKHEDSGYTEHRVCEDCGFNSRADWGSAYRAVPDARLMGKRAYSVSWSEYWSARPHNA